MKGVAQMAEKIKIHRMHGVDLDIEPAPVQREWMDRSPDRFAYRCLPLNIANAHGWQLRLRAGFRVRVIGEPGRETLEFQHETPDDPPAVSHFGMGTVTFHIPALITTPPGVALYVTGPVNQTKPGIAPLSGIVETDWLPFTFTMNWRLYVRDRWVRFDKGEPFCMFFPVKLDDIEAYDVEVCDLADNPRLQADLEAYSQSRQKFLEDLAREDPVAKAKGWQKDYMQGPAVKDNAPRHRTSLKLAKPRDV